MAPSRFTIAFLYLCVKLVLNQRFVAKAFLTPSVRHHKATWFFPQSGNHHHYVGSSLRLFSSLTSNQQHPNHPISNIVPLDKISDESLNPSSLPPVKVHVIAHRGASGGMPDHTLESYRAAFLEGADYIEIDVQCTLDGHLIVNHDVDLGETTDVADWPWAAPLKARTRASPCHDGNQEVVEGWMVAHLTLEQVKQLRVIESNKCRPQEYNKLYEVPTLEETCNFVQSMVNAESFSHLSQTMTKSEWLQHRNRYTLKFGKCRPNPKVGLYIETKRPTWYREMLGLPIEEELVNVVESSNFEGPVMIQSFESDSLRRMQELKPEWKTVKLLTRQEVNLLTMNEENGGLSKYMKELACVGIDGIGPDKLSIVPDPTSPPSKSILVETAHEHGLVVHPYTFQSDVSHLHRIYGGNASQEFALFFKLGVDGVFADFPGHGVFARELYNRLQIQGMDFLSYSEL